MRLTSRLIATLAAAAATAAVGLAPHPHSIPAASALPAFSHIVVVVEENHSYDDIIGSGDAPYINSLASGGALMTQSFAVTHPSEPNYLALFAGSTFGLSSDKCPVKEGTTANLGSELLAAGSTFKGYAEDLPATGYTVCTSGNYARKHAPWVDFSNVPGSDSAPFSAFPSDYSTLPALSFVIPNLQDDMHDGTIAQGDTWLQGNLSAYASWAQANNSLLVVTWDEDDYSESNQIPTLFYGAHVAAGSYDETVDHYSVLATLEDLTGVARTGDAGSATAITDIWN